MLPRWSKAISLPLQIIFIDTQIEPVMYISRRRQQRLRSYLNMDVYTHVGRCRCLVRRQPEISLLFLIGLRSALSCLAEKTSVAGKKSRSECGGTKRAETDEYRKDTDESFCSSAGKRGWSLLSFLSDADSRSPKK